MKPTTLITMVTLATVCFTRQVLAQGLVYVSNLGDLWAEGGIGDIHNLFPGGAPYGTDTARFTTGSGNFSLTTFTLEFFFDPSITSPSAPDWVNLQLYKQTKGGDLLIGTLGNPIVDPAPTQWPQSANPRDYTTFIDFSPLQQITLNPFSQYSVVASVPANSPVVAALVFTKSSSYTTSADWDMGATTAGNPYADGEYLVMSVSARSVPEPDTEALVMGTFIVLIGCRRFMWPNTALEPTPTAPLVYGWFELYNDYRVCGTTRRSAWLSFLR
jgi:hypothetical protein